MGLTIKKCYFCFKITFIKFRKITEDTMVYTCKECGNSWTDMEKGESYD